MTTDDITSVRIDPTALDIFKSIQMSVELVLERALPLYQQGYTESLLVSIHNQEDTNKSQDCQVKGP